jgi:uncharacterized protein (TIGR03790 family)
MRSMTWIVGVAPSFLGRVSEVLIGIYFYMAKTEAVKHRRSAALRGGWQNRCCALALVVLGLVVPRLGSAAAAEPAASAASGHGASATRASEADPARIALRWRPVPRVIGRVTADSLGVVINTADPYSVEVGDYYIRQRRIAAAHVLRLELPVQARLSEPEFEALKRRIDAFFGADVQGLALAWTVPYAVSCQSITGALALGLDAELCRRTCDKAQLSPYFNSPSGAPFRDHGLRPSMLLASRTVAEAKSLIDRGVAADHTLGLRGAPPVHAYYMATPDSARSVRLPLSPPPGPVGNRGVVVHVQAGNLPTGDDRLLLVQTGLANLPNLDGLPWVRGALADHLTSFGGLLDQTEGQSNALAWLASGATASYGTVSEPCNHLQKFPHPQILLLHYLQGSTALEAYWKSVAWPQQGVFVGEPLAAPFSAPALPR